MLDQTNLAPIISRFLFFLSKFTSSQKPERFESLEQTLTRAIDGSPDEQKQAISLILEEITSDPRARIGLIRSLKISGTNLDNDYGGFFRQLLEKKHGRSETRLLVCPIDPTHYRKRETANTMNQLCPLHGIPLISE